MKPKIGYSILSLRKFSKETIPFDTYELRSSLIKPNIKKVLNLKKDFGGMDLSLHSKLNRIFSCKAYGYNEFSNHELEILKYEIMISKIIGIKRINFHMTNLKLEKEEIERFNKIIEFAKDNGVELIYENHVCSANAILYIKKIFPGLKMCLDLGHLNIAIKQNIFEMKLEEFIEKINDRIIHVHAHNNDGERDTHSKITKGTLDWENILKKLTHLEKVIIEVKDLEDALQTKKILEKFYS